MNAPTTTCPVCGGEIHAIAGRCKHCKADLGRWRQAQARAARSARARERDAERDAAAPEPSAPSPPPAGSPPAQPAPRAAGWSRRWPVLVMGIALFTIGVSVGMLAERWRQSPSDPGASPERASRRTSASPRRVPDHMPRPMLPAPSPSPSPQAAPAPPPAPAPEDVDHFVNALTDSLCDKLTECGLIEGNARAMCGLFAEALEDDESAARIRRGECDFDGAAAERCLQAIESLRCDAAASTDVLDWLLAAESLEDCSNAFSCP